MDKILQRIKSSTDRLSILYKAIILAFCLIFILASIEIYRAHYLTYLFFDIFVRGLFHPRFFSIIQLLFLAVMVGSLFYFRLKNKNTTLKERLFMYYIILCYVLNMVNPNNDTNNPILGMPLLSNLNEYLLILLVVFYTYWSSEDFLTFIFTLFKFLTIALLLRAIYLMGMWATGNGQKGFFGINATLTESDTLFIYCFFQIIYFGLFFIFKKKKFLYISLFFLLFIILSYRRTFTFISILGTFTVILYYIFYAKKSFSVVISLTFILLLAYPASYYISTIDFETDSRLLRRMLSALPNSRYNTGHGEFSDSGHWEQTTQTTVNFFNDEVKFFGTGYGNTKEGVVEGQSVTIHNIFIATWAYVGFHLFVLVLFLLFFTVRSFIRYALTYRKLNPKSDEYDYNFSLITIKITLIVVLLYYLAGLSFASIPFFNSLKMEFFWISFLFFIIKINESNWKAYFMNGNMNTASLRK